MQSSAVNKLAFEVKKAPQMPKIKKPAPRPQVVIPDTSVLWHEDKRHAVSPAFDEFWSAHSGLVILRLVVPDPVRQELLFQQTTSACKKLDSVAEHMETISGITAHTHRHRLQKDKLQRQIATKFDRWLNGKVAVVHPIPYARIDWPKICEASAWRFPPFTLNPKNLDWEKGFRDAMILETVVDYASTCSDEVNIAFVCGDRLLRETTFERLKTDPRCSSYESLQDLGSYIKLTREQLTNAFIKAILRRARRKFYTAGDDSCLFMRAKIGSQLQELEKNLLANPTSADSLANPYEAVFSTPRWKRTGVPSQYFIPGPQFQRVVDDADYYWKTVITHIAEFQDTQTIPLPNRILIIPTSIFWHARISADGRFRTVVFDSLQAEKSSFRVPSEEDIKVYANALTTLVAPPTVSPS